MCDLRVYSDDRLRRICTAVTFVHVIAFSTNGTRGKNARTNNSAKELCGGRMKVSTEILGEGFVSSVIGRDLVISAAI